MEDSLSYLDNLDLLFEPITFQKSTLRNNFVTLLLDMGIADRGDWV